MKSTTLPRTRKLRIIAQDPSVRDSDGYILTTEIEIPAEELAPGPRGYRVHVVDYDTSTGTLYQPQPYKPLKDGCYIDPYADVEKEKTNELLAEPGFHAQNVYAIVMRTLARFESALGRRVSWGFQGHQIYVAPHAFADANAFYSKRDQALAFGYFRIPSEDDKSEHIFTCLSHDVVAHETTHAILDGLRERYTTPSSPEQAGFHEGFADVVALLSVFSLKDVVKNLLTKKSKDKNGLRITSHRLPVKVLTEKHLRDSTLFGLAEQMGQALSGIRGNALRRSAQLPTLDNLPSTNKKSVSYLKTKEFQEPHRCGELLVAAMMNAFLKVWLTRLDKYVADRTEVDVSIVVDEGAAAADHLLTMAIRALDYMPPTDIRFHDYLSAVLTSDRETVPDDSRYEYRKIIRDSFAGYGINPAEKADSDGYWNTVDGNFSFDRTHFESLLREPNEIFRFIWDNRSNLRLETEEDYFGKAYMKVQSVRPCLRIGPDGFIVRETVAEYVQMTTLRADELPDLGINIISEIPDEMEIMLYGGGTLIFDEYGKLKFHIQNSIFSRTNQPERIKYLWQYGYFTNQNFTENIFFKMHLNRVLTQTIDYTEGF
jgi:hypothetical protein